MDLTTLLIDLDDTVYPRDSGVWQAIRGRIDQYVAERFGLDGSASRDLRQQLFLRYGTTMRGLQAEYQVDEDEYLAYVHNVPLAEFLRPNPALGAVLRQLPQRKLIFTNADVHHARRVLAVLGIGDCFDALIDIKAIAPYCKPMPAAFEIALRLAGEPDPARCALVDDQPLNIRAARQAGLYTVRVGPPSAPEEAHAAVQQLVDLPLALSAGGE